LLDSQPTPKTAKVSFPGSRPFAAVVAKGSFGGFLPFQICAACDTHGLKVIQISHFFADLQSDSVKDRT
jgi:hypothetical protein